MRSTPTLPLALLLATLVACKPKADPPAPPAPPAEQWQTSSIAVTDCRSEVDAQDPNATPYLVCPGAAGIVVRVRSVESGRASVDLVLPSQRVVPLALQEHVSRRMFSLEGPLRWRLEQQDGRWQARALALQVAERADSDDPALVTRRVDALARLDTDGACIVALRPAAAAASGADPAWPADALARPCAPVLPE